MVVEVVVIVIVVFDIVDVMEVVVVVVVVEVEIIILIPVCKPILLSNPPTMEVPDLCIPNTINPGRYDDGIVATCTAAVVVFDVVMVIDGIGR